MEYSRPRYVVFFITSVFCVEFKLISPNDDSRWCDDFIRGTNLNRFKYIHEKEIRAASQHPLKSKCENSFRWSTGSPGSLHFSPHWQVLSRRSTPEDWRLWFLPGPTGCSPTSCKQQGGWWDTLHKCLLLLLSPGRRLSVLWTCVSFLSFFLVCFFTPTFLSSVFVLFPFLDYYLQPNSWNVTGWAGRALYIARAGQFPALIISCCFYVDSKWWATGWAAIHL